MSLSLGQASPEPLNVASLFTRYLSALQVAESDSSDLLTEAQQVLADVQHHSISTDCVDAGVLDTRQGSPPQNGNETLLQNEAPPRNVYVCTEGDACLSGIAQRNHQAEEGSEGMLDSQVEGDTGSMIGMLGSKEEASVHSDGNVLDSHVQRDIGSGVLGSKEEASAHSDDNVLDFHLEGDIGSGVLGSKEEASAHSDGNVLDSHVEGDTDELLDSQQLKELDQEKRSRQVIQ